MYILNHAVLMLIIWRSSFSPRFRSLYEDRFDNRKALYDWDYHASLKTTASIIHIKQYKGFPSIHNEIVFIHSHIHKHTNTHTHTHTLTHTHSHTHTYTHTHTHTHR